MSAGNALSECTRQSRMGGVGVRPSQPQGAGIDRKISAECDQSSQLVLHKAKPPRRWAKSCLTTNSSIKPCHTINRVTGPGPVLCYTLHPYGQTLQVRGTRQAHGIHTKRSQHASKPFIEQTAVHPQSHSCATRMILTHTLSLGGDVKAHTIVAAHKLRYSPNMGVLTVL